jgi:hypothetical protein
VEPLFSSQISMAVQLGKQSEESHAKANSVVRWRSKSAEDALVAAAESLKRFALPRT